MSKTTLFSGGNNRFLNGCENKTARASSALAVFSQGYGGDPIQWFNPPVLREPVPLRLLQWQGMTEHDAAERLSDSALDDRSGGRNSCAKEAGIQGFRPV
jgi:hypothetical protein